MTEEQAARVSRLSKQQVAEVDAALVAEAGPRWRKVAMLVGLAMSKLHASLPGIPDLFYAERVRRMVDAGLLESQGDLGRMRFSEVRMRASTSHDESA